MKYLLLLLLIVKIQLYHVDAAHVAASMGGTILNISGSYWSGGSNSGY